jgi:hypothetical protein
MGQGELRASRTFIGHAKYYRRRTGRLCAEHSLHLPQSVSLFLQNTATSYLYSKPLSNS